MQLSQSKEIKPTLKQQMMKLLRIGPLIIT
jgi:hypothetical protein